MNKNVEMLDEYVPDYTLPVEEEKARFKKYLEKIEKALEEIEKQP